MRPWFRSWVNHMMSWFRYEGVFKVPKADAKERDKFIFQIPQKDEKVSFGYTISQKKISREYDDEDKAARAFDIELVAIGLKAVNFPNYSDVYNLEQYLSGLTKEDRNWFGIFPLKGKLLNTLDAAQSKINNNTEITNIKKIYSLKSERSLF